MLKKIKIEKQTLVYPLVLFSMIWLGFLLQYFGFFSNCFGAIIPLSPEGLKGVLLSPFLHANLEHIAGNSLSVLVLSFLLFQFYSNIARKIVFIGVLATGLLVWGLPPIDITTKEFYYTCIIGASGVVYVLAFFLFFSGVFRLEPPLLSVSLVVALYYGGLVWGIFPEELFYVLKEPSRISWQSHLSGALVGIVLAFLFRKSAKKKRQYIWQFPNYYNEKDDRLWQEYQKKYPEDFQEIPTKKQSDIWQHLDKIRRDDGQENQ